MEGNRSIDGAGRLAWTRRATSTASLLVFVLVVSGSLVTISPHLARAADPVVDSMTGEIEQAPIPPSLESGDFVSQTHIRLLDEGVGLVTADMPAFAFDAATYADGLVITPASGPGLPDPGTEVHSVLLHFDPDVGGLPFSLTMGVSRSAVVTFSQDILGVYVSSTELVASDGAFGSGDIFTADYRREMEFTYAGDSFAIDPGRRQLEVTMFGHNGGFFDEMRVILVEPPNQPPVAVDDEAQAGQGGSVEIAVLGNDIDPDFDSLAVSTIAQPDHGDASTDGLTVTYQSDADFCGAEMFEYTVDDGRGGSDLGTISIIVACAVDTLAPTISLIGANPQQLIKGDVYSEPGASAHDDTDGDVTDSLSIDASLVDTSAPGTYSVRYSVEDANGNSAVALRVVQVLDYFSDDDSSIFEHDINSIADVGIVRGCNPPANDRYCPKDLVSRETMAAFLVRALGLTDDDHPGFTDVAPGSTFETDIEKLAKAGITRGCNPPANDRYCPKDLVSRETMAAFLNRAGWSG
jgi:Bacterial Ig domain/Bacterial surface protein, Ig-like domain